MAKKTDLVGNCVMHGEYFKDVEDSPCPACLDHPEDDPNVNCLEGIRCPKCKQRDRFHVQGYATFEVVDDGSEAIGDHEYDGSCKAYCPDCGYVGKWDDFHEDEPVDEVPSADVEGDYSWVTDDMFDSMLLELLEDVSRSTILAIPGVYELVKEHYNNAVLEALDAERQRKGK